jgi:hypothetical protein
MGASPHISFLRSSRTLQRRSFICYEGKQSNAGSPQHIPDWAFPVLIAVCLFNLVCAIALFRWKKWGFWGLVVSAAVALGVNIAIGLGPLAAIGGIIGVLLLYGVLQIGKENKGWSQLE